MHANMDKRKGHAKGETRNQSFELVLWFVQIGAAVGMAAGVARMIQDPSDWGLPATVASLIVFLLVRNMLRPIPRHGEGSAPDEIGRSDDE
jgi:hypothetical protein